MKKVKINYYEDKDLWRAFLRIAIIPQIKNIENNNPELVDVHDSKGFSVCMGATREQAKKYEDKKGYIIENVDNNKRIKKLKKLRKVIEDDIGQQIK